MHPRVYRRGFCVRQLCKSCEAVFHHPHRGDGLGVDLRQVHLNGTHDVDAGELSELLHGVIRRSNPLRAISDHDVGVEDFSLVGVLGPNRTLRGQEAGFHVPAEHLEHRLRLAGDGSADV